MGLALRSLLAFAGWNLIVWPLLPLYARAVTPAAASLWNAVTPHGQSLAFGELFPRLLWRCEPLGVAGELSFPLLTYNLALYLTAVSVAPRVPRATRLLWLAPGLAALFLWHLGDLLLSAETRLLAALRPHGDGPGPTLDPLLLAVEVARDVTVLGLRQAVPCLLVGLQWLWWLRRRAAR